MERIKLEMINLDIILYNSIYYSYYNSNLYHGTIKCVEYIKSKKVMYHVTLYEYSDNEKVIYSRLFTL